MMRTAASQTDVHDCVEDGDHVKIVADVLTMNNYVSVHLIAHGPRCKEYPKEPKCSCMNLIGG